VSLDHRSAAEPSRPRRALPLALLRGVCGRGLSGNPISTIGFERRHNHAVQFSSEEEFAQALMRDIPPAPEQQAAIVRANRSGRPLAEVG
jgi:hydroxyacylglutathione hydrolase